MTERRLASIKRDVSPKPEKDSADNYTYGYALRLVGLFQGADDARNDRRKRNNDAHAASNPSLHEEYEDV